MCDYALWAMVNKRMRKQEQKWPDGKKETRDQYLTRLRELKDTIPGVYEPRYVASFTRVAPVALWALVEAMGVGMHRFLGPDLLPVLREGLSGRAARMRT